MRGKGEEREGEEREEREGRRGGRGQSYGSMQCGV